MKAGEGRLMGFGHRICKNYHSRAKERDYVELEARVPASALARAG